MSDLSRYKFSGLQLCKLVGISHHQFQSFKLAGLIDNKPKYTLNDVIYVSISNVFRECKISWSSIYKLYNDVFGSPQNFLNFIYEDSFLDMDFLLLIPTNDDGKIFFTLKKNFQQIPLKNFTESLKNVLKLESGFFVKNVSEDSIQILYGVYVDKVVKKIIQNSKQINLKVDIKKILLSA